MFSPAAAASDAVDNHEKNSTHAASFFSVLTYNVNFAYAQRPSRVDPEAVRVAAALRELDEEVDVACLQETHAGWTTFLASSPHGAPEFVSPQRRPYKAVVNVSGGAGGIVVYSKLPILRHSTLFPKEDGIKGSWFPMWLGELQLASKGQRNKTIILAVVHLRPPLEDDGSAGIFTARRTNPIRRAELQYLAQRIEQFAAASSPTRSSGPVIVVGDFNEHDSAPGIQSIQQRLHLRDALNEFVPPNRETHRWPFLKGLYISKKRLDHVLYSSAKEVLTCQACRVVDGYEEGASDHQPVVARFGVPDDDGDDYEEEEEADVEVKQQQQQTC
ncbi:Endo/exonuclease/phosphatase domain-containing protein [Balamuthia mandrillaris]